MHPFKKTPPFLIRTLAAFTRLYLRMRRFQRPTSNISMRGTLIQPIKLGDSVLLTRCVQGRYHTLRGSDQIAERRTPHCSIPSSRVSPSAPCTSSTNEMVFEGLELCKESPVRARQNVYTCVKRLVRFEGSRDFVV